MAVVGAIAIFRQLTCPAPNYCAVDSLAAVEFLQYCPQREGQASLNQPPNHGENDCIGVLHNLAPSLKGHVRKKVVSLCGGTTLTRQLRALYRGHKIDLLANSELILADVEASYGRFELFVINPRPSTRFGKPARPINTATAKHVIFTIDGNLSPSQSELCESGVLERLLDVIDPDECEEINVSQRLVRVYLERPSMNRVVAIIHAVIDLMPHDERAVPEFASLPDALRPLIPLLAKWAIDDDDERSRKLKRCTPSARKKLIDAVVPLLPAIDNFLDSFGANPPEGACALGSLAQAALEAQSLLREATQTGA